VVTGQDTVVFAPVIVTVRVIESGCMFITTLATAASAAGNSARY